MDEIKILYIEDETDAANELKAILEAQTIEELPIKVETENDFNAGIEKIKNNNYNIIILDLCDDKNGDQDRSGESVLMEVQKHSFTPIIFYSGHAHNITDLNSCIIRVISKGGDGTDQLEDAIKDIVRIKLAGLRNAIHKHIDDELNSYFWGTIHPERSKFPPKTDFSLSHLILRRISNSLSINGISKLLNDPTISEDKMHPMGYYIYPTNTLLEYSYGEIVKKDDEYFVILTPTCDFQLRDGKRNVEYVILNKAIELSKHTSAYENYKSSKSASSQKELTRLINNNSSRYHFLPKTLFIPNLLMDFQNKMLISYDDLKGYSRLATLDSPFAESMLIRHISYYNRIGTPDIDIDYILDNL